MKVINVVDEITERIDGTIVTLASAETTPNPRFQAATLIAVQDAKRIWESELETHQPNQKVDKLVKSFSRVIDYQVKHNTGGARNGYTLVMNSIRLYI